MCFLSKSLVQMLMGLGFIMVVKECLQTVYVLGLEVSSEKEKSYILNLFLYIVLESGCVHDLVAQSLSCGF